MEESYPAKTPVESARDAGISLRQEMRIYGGGLWEMGGPTGTDRLWGPPCGSVKSMSAKRSKRSLGKHNSGYMSGIESCWPRARTRGRSDGGRTRVAGFYLGHRDPSRNSAE